VEVAVSSGDNPQPVIVVGHDGSDRGGDALALGAVLATELGGRLVIAGVYYKDYPQWPGSEDLEAELRRLTLEPLEKIDLGSLGVPAEIKAIRARSEARGLHELAEEVGAELVVVGSTHRGKIGRVLPGSTGQRLLQESPCAVAVAPLGYAAETRLETHRVGVGFDRSIESEAAIALAARLATRTQANLRIITVVEPHMMAYADPMTGAMYASEAVDSQRANAQKSVDAIREKIPTPQPVEGVVREGHAVDELVEAAEDLDVIVLGSRAYGPIGRALAGSVSSGVAHRAACPVVIVPRSVAERSHAPSGALAGSRAAGVG
jgi:nucleotide-binding universal stress UspA family protein